MSNTLPAADAAQQAKDQHLDDLVAKLAGLVEGEPLTLALDALLSAYACVGTEHGRTEYIAQTMVEVGIKLLVQQPAAAGLGRARLH